jgi:hypothetical protein
LIESPATHTQSPLEGLKAMPFELSDALKAQMTDDWVTQIDQTQRILRVIEKRRVDFIALPNPPDLTNKEHLNRSYNVLIQSHLRRFLCLIDAMELTWNTGRLLPCTIMGRSCMESAAMLALINTKLQKLVGDKNYNKAYFWVASNMLLVKTDIEAFGYEDVSLKSIHIMDAIRAVEAILRGYLDTYNWLSEFLHPNSLGVFASFCKYLPDQQSATFLDNQEISGKAIYNCMAGLLCVPVFAMALDQAKDIGEKIVSTDWRGDDELLKLFWPNDPADALS